jgi:acetoin utilization deacetylase AcuC-like enzyme
MTAINDWHLGIEQSKVFIAIVSDAFFEDARAIEQVLYAKNLNKPTILVIKYGTDIFKTDLLKNMDIIEKIYINPANFNGQDIAKKIAEAIKKYEAQEE